MTAQEWDWQGAGAALATMHGKEAVIAPLVERFLGLRVAVVQGLNTDAFGTFSREIARRGSPRDAARAKVDAGLAHMPDLRIGLASEGSFGPHPQLPFCAIDREIVMLVDRATDLELVGLYATPDTNFGHAVVTDVPAGLAFAAHAGFPSHGVIVLASCDDVPRPDIALEKDLDTEAALAAALDRVISRAGAAFVETDMRAHRNPRRMRAIKHATIDLLRRARSRCPACGQPGFSVTERCTGLPCRWCGAPTQGVQAEVLACAGCDCRTTRVVATEPADPAWCAECNP